MQHMFDCLSEWIEHAFSTWWGVGLYAVLSAVAYVLAGWDGLDRFVYMTGALIVILLIGSGRRDSKAAQAKLDTLTEGAELDRLEELSEAEIEARRRT